MKFGVIKSKIENVLTESFITNSFKDQIFVFEELVLKNKNLKKIYFLYDELSTNKGLSKSLAESFINECITVFENTVNKITKEEIKELESWVGSVNTNNQYSEIDNLFSSNLSLLESKIKSRDVILNTLQKNPENEETITTTLDEVVDVANKTINDYISNLSESEQLKIKNVLKESDKKLQLKFDLLKETMVEKLTEIKESENDSEVLEKINLTIEKIQTENFDRLNYLKLKELERSL
jgi:hypothetical protein